MRGAAAYDVHAALWLLRSHGIGWPFTDGSIRLRQAVGSSSGLMAACAAAASLTPLGSRPGQRLVALDRWCPLAPATLEHAPGMAATSRPTDGKLLSQRATTALAAMTAAACCPQVCEPGTGGAHVRNQLCFGLQTGAPAWFCMTFLA